MSHHFEIFFIQYPFMVIYWEKRASEYVGEGVSKRKSVWEWWNKDVDKFKSCCRVLLLLRLRFVIPLNFSVMLVKCLSVCLSICIGIMLYMSGIFVCVCFCKWVAKERAQSAEAARCLLVLSMENWFFLLIAVYRKFFG